MWYVRDRAGRWAWDLDSEEPQRKGYSTLEEAQAEWPEEGYEFIYEREGGDWGEP
jgi:hypothetical protein